jgi:predicted RNase H-like nuclease (RuvC/YqgF family)
MKSEERGKERRNKTNYDMLGIFVQLCYKMGVRLEELHGSHEELQEYVDELHEKIANLNQELQAFRDCLKSE